MPYVCSSQPQADSSVLGACNLGVVRDIRFFKVLRVALVCYGYLSLGSLSQSQAEPSGVR